MKSKIVLITALIGVGGLIACQGNSPTSSTEADTQQEAVSDTPENSSAAVDPAKKSDSKGIGKFKSVEVGPLNADMASKGEAIFSSKCLACHKTSDEKVVGPGLKGITERRTPEWIMNMITNPEEMTKKDPVAKALFEQHLVQMTFQNVSDQEARQVLEFLRKNDNGNN